MSGQVFGGSLSSLVFTKDVTDTRNRNNCQKEDGAANTRQRIGKMIKYIPAGLVTDDPVIAVNFIDEEIEFFEDGHWRMAVLESVDGAGATVRIAEGYARYPEIVRIPRPVVCELMQPVEGEGYVEDDSYTPNAVALLVEAGYRLDAVNAAMPIPKRYYHKRILNIVTTRADLRELVRWAVGK